MYPITHVGPAPASKNKVGLHHSRVKTYMVKSTPNHAAANIVHHNVKLKLKMQGSVLKIRGIKVNPVLS